MNHDYYMHGGDGSHPLEWVILVLLVILLVAVIVAVAARLGAPRLGVAGHGALPRPPGEDPLELLRLRYARGEIDRDAFLQATEDLGGNPPPAA